ncbi:MAG: HD domain-containing protein [Planctomycetota bacterium]|jgi:(p)ppGpp synthase/HD superfamily hydrolase|nr:HD domain-containing protein [Planctomycetota bacterium]
MTYSTKLREAASFAIDLHREQTRKGGGGIPYVTHLFAVASLVGEDGGSEDEVIAALLHDGPEDQGGEETLQMIRGRFGENVAEIVLGCTDTLEDPKPAWRPRKEAFIAQMEGQTPSVMRVSCADKLHNARCTLSDLREQGSSIWALFSGKRDDTLWYYKSLVDVYDRRFDSPLKRALAEVVQDLEEEAGYRHPCLKNEDSRDS